MVRVIAVASGKGGVGKTTVALNLGTVLTYHFKKNVTLIDCNVTTSHLGMYLGMYYSPITLNKALRGEVSLKEAVYTHFGGMKVVPASLSLSDLEGVDITKLREKIESISDESEIIFLDGAPGLGREAIATLKAADEVLFVTTPFVPSVMDIVRTMEVVNEIGIKPIGIILNMVNREKYEMTSLEVEQLTRVPVIGSIPFDKNVYKSLVEKLPVVIFRPNTKATKSFVKLGANLIGYEYKKKSILSRIADKLKLRRKTIVTPPALLGPDLQSQMMFSEAPPSWPASLNIDTSQPDIQRPKMPGPEMPHPEKMTNTDRE